jgi:hypothetical protein
MNDEDELDDLEAKVGGHGAGDDAAVRSNELDA